MYNKLSNIPLEMRERRQWVCANYDKKPLVPNNGRAGMGADVNNPNDWGTFEDAVDLWIAHPSVIMGVGFVLTANDPFVIVDFDDKPERPAAPGAKLWFGQACMKLGCYVERSISGYGFHALLKGDFPRGIKAHGLELYGAQRYMLCTGDMVQAGPVVHDQEFINSLAELIETTRPDTPGGKYEFNDIVAKKDDERVMAHFNALNLDLFNLYQTGDWQSYVLRKGGGDQSQSRADLAMVQALCSCTESDDQIIRLWKHSPLSPWARKPPSQKKPKPEDYMRRTIGLARAHVANDRKSSAPPVTISMGKKEAEANWQEAEVPAPPPPPPPQSPVEPAPVQMQGPFPPGLLGDIARYVYSVAPRPIEDLAMAAAIGYMAGICGRTYNVSDTGLNQYVLVVANSGIGKEGMKHGIDKLQRAVGRISNHAGKFIGPANFTTGAAVQKHLEEEPCCLSLFTEFGQMLTRFNSQRDEHAKLLKAALLAAYVKSGFSSIMDKQKYSKEENSIQHINSPNLSILAEGTQSTVFDNLPLGSILDGFLPRFICFEYNGERPDLNTTRGDPPPQLITRLAELMERVEQARQGKQVMDGPGAGMIKDKPYTGEEVQFTPDADAYSLQMVKRIDREYNLLESDAQRALNSRVYLSTLKLAALCAVGVNFYGPVITLPILQWAEKLARRSQDTFLAKLQSGEIGGSILGQREHAIIQLAKQFIVEGAPAAYFTPKTNIQALREGYCVPYDYIRRRARRLKVFAEDGNNGRDMLPSIMKSLNDSEVLVQVAAAEAKEKFGHANVWMLMRPD